MDWYKAAQVTVDNGSKIVRVVSGELVAAINAHDGLLIGSFTGRDILNTYTEDVTNDQIIELVLPWDEVTQTLQPARVQPSPVNFNAGATALTNAVTKVFAQLASFDKFATQASGTVTFTPFSDLDPNIVIKSLGQYQTELDALTIQAQGSVDAVDAIEEQVNGVGGLVEVVAGIDTTLQGYVSSASDDATKAQEYAVNAYGVVITGTTDYSSLHYATDSNNAKVIAVQAKDDIATLKSDVTTLKDDTNTLYLATIESTALAQTASTEAQDAAASVTATLYFVGGWDASGNTAPPVPTGSGNPFYKITVAGTFAGNAYDINDNTIWDAINTTWIKIDNTENVVSVNGKQGVVVIAIADIAGLQASLDALQTNINTKAPLDSPTFTGTVNGIDKAMVGLPEADNTSDLDKVISNDVQAALDTMQSQIDTNRIFAFAGMGL